MCIVSQVKTILKFKSVFMAIRKIFQPKLIVHVFMLHLFIIVVFQLHHICICDCYVYTVLPVSLYYWFIAYAYKLGGTYFSFSPL